MSSLTIMPLVGRELRGLHPLGDEGEAGLLDQLQVTLGTPGANDFNHLPEKK